MADHEAPELHPVATDQPGGLILHRPRKKLVQVAIAYAVLPLVCAGLGGWIAVQTAYHRSSERTDRRIAALENDLAERRAIRDRENATRDAQVRRVGQIVCVLADRAQPRDAEVERIRAEFGCTANPAVPAPSPGVNPSPGVTGNGARPRPPRGTPDSGSLPPRRVDPAPTPAPPPAPRPSPPDGGGAPGGGPILGCLDLPLLPEICL